MPIPQEVIDIINHIIDVQRNPEGLAFTRQETLYEPEDDNDSLQDNTTVENNTTDLTKHAEIAGVDSDEDMTNTTMQDQHDDADLETITKEAPLPLAQETEALEHEAETELVTDDATIDNDGNANNDETSETPENTGVPTIDNDMVSPKSTPRTRSGRIPSNRFRLHSVEEGYEFSMLGNKYKTSYNDTIRGKYRLATEEIVRLASKKVEDFLCAQATYIESLARYNEVNLATQHAIEHLIFT